MRFQVVTSRTVICSRLLATLMAQEKKRDAECVCKESLTDQHEYWYSASSFGSLNSKDQTIQKHVFY
jgi:hypothetical protein